MPIRKDVSSGNRGFKAPATLSQVAARAGVSVSTVSRIVGQKGQVSPAKRAAVEKAIAELNFTPNALAQGLKRGRSFTIGVITPTMYGLSFFDTLNGIDIELQNTSYNSIIVASHFDKKQELERCKLLLGHRVDALIILSARLDADTIRSLAERTPIITFGQKVDAPSSLGILTDNRLGGYLATRHLIELGHRRILHLSGPADRKSANQRLDGYRQALDEADIDFDPRLVVDAQYTEQGALAAFAHIFQVGTAFTAVFAGNDQSALGTILALRKRGLRVPDDVSLVGFDDIFGASYSNPPLTTVRIPMFEMGRQAARGAIDLLENRKAEISAPPPTLVIRETTSRLWTPH